MTEDRGLLPLRVEEDWTDEIYAADGTLLVKCMKPDGVGNGQGVGAHVLVDIVNASHARVEALVVRVEQTLR